MKYWFYVLMITLSLFSNAALSMQEVSTSPLVIGHNIEFKSDILGTTVSLNIALPTYFYESSDEHTYPVIFANGSHGNEFFPTLVGVVKHLSELDRMPESIVVSLNDSGYYPTTYTNGMWGREVLEAYEDPVIYSQFLQEELIPYLEKHYRAADDHTMIGVSGSALFPLFSLVKTPDLMDFYIFTTSHDMIGMGFESGKDVLAQLAHTFTRPATSQTHLYFAVADDDIDRNNPERDLKYQQNMARLNQVLARIDDNKLKSKVEIVDNERHYDVYIKALLAAFEFRYPVHRWAKKYRELIALPGDAMTNIESHYQALSKEYGFTVLPKSDRWNSVNCLRLVSRILMRDDRIDESLRVIQRWIQLRPQSSQPYERQAEVYQQLGDDKKALAALEMAVTRAKNSDKDRLSFVLEKQTALLKRLQSAG